MLNISYVRVTPVNFTKYGFGKVPTKQKGVADIIACINGLFIAFECKREKGGVQSKFQKAYQKLLEANKGLYFLINDKAQFDIILNDLTCRNIGK